MRYPKPLEELGGKTMKDVFSNSERAQVLTQALPYIKRYTGKTVVVKYGGNAMINETLKQQVMEDIVLLWLIGVKIVLVHGGGPEINELMDKLGKKPEFIDGLRVTDKETQIVALALVSRRLCFLKRDTANVGNTLDGDKVYVGVLLCHSASEVSLAATDLHMYGTVVAEYFVKPPQHSRGICNSQLGASLDPLRAVLFLSHSHKVTSIRR